MTAPDPEQVRQLGEASQWLARLREEPHSEKVLTSWLKWCESDPAHAEAFERVQQLWRQLDQVPVDIRAAAGRRRRGHLFRRPQWSAAAALLVCATVAGAVWKTTHRPSPEAALESAVPENRLASLPDGSSVH